jgi:hypothetical protein
VIFIKISRQRCLYRGCSASITFESGGGDNFFVIFFAVFESDGLKKS